MALILNESEVHLAEECFLGYMIYPYNNTDHECLMTASYDLTKDEELELHPRI